MEDNSLEGMCVCVYLTVCVVLSAAAVCLCAPVFWFYSPSASSLSEVGDATKSDIGF